MDRRCRLGTRVFCLATGLAGVTGLLCPDRAAAQNRAVSMPLRTSRVDPKEFGLLDATITKISAWSFSAGVNGDLEISAPDGPHVSPTLGRFNSFQFNDVHYYSTLDIPAGALINFIGINTSTDTDAVIGVALWKRNKDGAKVPLASFSVPAHGWDTDFSLPVDATIESGCECEYLLDVETAGNENYQSWAWVEVWWHRTVSPAPPTPSFNDVPADHPFFQFIEALKASGITGGCGGGNYCPDSPVTRGQMAVFLSKALGLHWPY